MSKFFILIIFLGTAPFLVRAEALVLDLEAAVKVALKQSPVLAQIRKDSEIAHWDQRTALSAYLPHLVSNFSVQRYHNHPSLLHKENYQLDLIFRQNLVDFSQIAKIKAASLGRDYQTQSEFSYRQVLVFDVIRYFYRCLLDRQKLEIRKRALGLAKEELSIAQLRYKEGLVSYYDFLRSETRYLATSAELNKAESDYRKSLNEFSNLLGFEPAKDIILEGELVFDEPSFRVEALTQNLEVYHPRLLALGYLINQKQELLNSSRAEFFPTLQLEAVQSAPKYQANRSDWDHYWAAYLKISFPLFEGGRRYAQLKRNQAGLKKAELKKQEILNELKKDIDSFYQDYLSAKELMLSYRKNLEKSEELYQLVRERYISGESSEIELLDAHLNLVDIEFRYQEAKYQATVSYYGVLLAAGQLDSI